MKQLIYKFIRCVSHHWCMHVFDTIKEKCNIIKSEWIAAKMAECGQGLS